MSGNQDEEPSGQDEDLMNQEIPDFPETELNLQVLN